MQESLDLDRLPGRLNVAEGTVSEDATPLSLPLSKIVLDETEFVISTDRQSNLRRHTHVGKNGMAKEEKVDELRALQT